MPELIKIKIESLQILFDRLASSFKVIGPAIQADTILLREIGFRDIPFHSVDIHGPGFYRISQEKRPQLFSFSIGPDSFKRFLFPPVQELFEWHHDKGVLKIKDLVDQEPFVLFGLRACDIEALKLYDRIFSLDPVYKAKRANSFVIAINCLFPNENCFCPSLFTGPGVKGGADAVITEIGDSLLVEIYSERLLWILKEIPYGKVGESDIRKREEVIEGCKKSIKRVLDKESLKSLYQRLESPLWEEISRIDLECGNCTQVCPTCFCNSAYDRVRLSSFEKTSINGVRIREWDSCFSRNFARIHGGNFRPSRKARYRHWFMHKLIYMEEQFGMKGCVGCGRCITWCPAGIDLTEILRRLSS